MHAAAVKSAVGGETASQHAVMEAAIKKWFRTQDDSLKAERRRELLKQQEAVAQQMKEAVAAARAADKANANAAAAANGNPNAANEPVMEVSLQEARAMGTGGDEAVE